MLRRWRLPLRSSWRPTTARAIRIRRSTPASRASSPQQPPSRWIAPEWRGAWNQEGLFREHPAGILLPSVVLIRAGIPAGQAAYIVNMLYQVAVIALIPLVAGVVVKGFEARSLAWILQLLPVSFAYRIRGNQEHPLLMCFLALIYGTERARTEPRLGAVDGGLVLLSRARQGRVCDVRARQRGAVAADRFPGPAGARPIGGRGLALPPRSPLRR